MSRDERTLLTDLCARGLALLDIQKEMVRAAKQNSWPVRGRKTIVRAVLGWHLVTETLPAGYAGLAQVSGDFEAHGGTQKYLDDMRTSLKAQEISRESHLRQQRVANKVVRVVVKAKGVLMLLEGLIQ